MKTKFTLLAIVAFVFSYTNAQQALPNGGLDNWTSQYAPTGWTSYEDFIAPIQGTGLCSKDTVDKVQGTASAKLSSKYVSLASDTIGGILAVGTGSFSGGQPTLYGIPFTSSPDTLQFAYKYVPVGNDSAGVQILLHKQGGGAGIAGHKLAVFGPLDSTSHWVLLTIPLKSYYTDTITTADTLKLVFYSSALEVNTTPVGSVLHVDAVRLGYKSVPTFIENINSNLSVKVYPTPANDLVNIQTSEVLSGSSIVVYDMNGRVITHEFGAGANFELATSRWESGVYSFSILSNGAVVHKGRLTVQH